MTTVWLSGRTPPSLDTILLPQGTDVFQGPPCPRCWPPHAPGGKFGASTPIMQKGLCFLFVCFFNQTTWPGFPGFFYSYHRLGCVARRWLTSAGWSLPVKSRKRQPPGQRRSSRRHVAPHGSASSPTAGRVSGEVVATFVLGFPAFHRASWVALATAVYPKWFHLEPKAKCYHLQNKNIWRRQFFVPNT